MMTLRIARIPYLNTDPFFMEDSTTILLSPRQLGEAASRGDIDAGAMSVVDYFRLAERFEPLGNFGIAARGAAQSVLLFSRKPLTQLQGCAIDVTDETSTSGILLRLLLEQRHHVFPSSYHPANGQAQDVEARMVIGDEALRMRTQDRWTPFRVDLGVEWWLWQLLPFVFAIWVVRKDAPDRAKQQLVRSLDDALNANLQQMQPIIQRRSAALGMPGADIEQYLKSIRYRLDDADRQGMQRFRELLEIHHLL